MKVQEKTIIDVIGLSEDEKTCSKLFKFFFNPREEHGLNELVIKALIHVLVERGLLEKNSFSYDNVEIVSELKTLNNNRIDIVIRSNDIIIGIENKINADVYNDLEDYGRTLELLIPNAIKIVLSKYAENTNYEKTGFINILYSELAKELEKEMKNIENKQSRWYLFLEEFLVVLKGNNIQHYYSKEYPNEDLEKIDGDIEDKIRKFTDIVNSRMLGKKAKYKHCVKLDLTSYVGLKNFNVDARLTAYGWRIAVFVYTNKKVLSMMDFLFKNNFKILSENNQRFIIKEFDYNENISVVADYFVDLVNLLKDLKLEDN